jgi:hypothetical protein
MRRPLALALAALLVLAAVPLPVVAHSNHLTATSQVSDDGTVVVETLFVSQRAHLVVHADDGGELGAALGSTTLAPDGLRRNVAVSLDDAAWADWGGNRTVWVALHAPDGDGSYDADDPVFTRFGRPVAERVAVGKGDPALVTGRGFYGQTVDGPRVTVGRVTLPEAGLLVARDDDTDRVVGTRALDAGTHENVTVALNASYVAAGDGEVVVRVGAYRDDGDGVLGDGDRPIRAGERVVGTRLPVSVVDGGAGTPAVNSPEGPRVNTPTATPAGPTGAGSATGDPPTGPDPSTSSGSGPGLGPEGALLAVALAAALAGLARRSAR